MFIYTKDSVPTSSLGAVAFENFNVNCTYADTVLESFMNVDEAASGTESDIWTTITLETSVTETGGAEYSFDIDTETDVDDEDNIISDIIRLYSEIPDPIEEVEKVAEVGEVAEVAGEPNATDVTNAALQAQAVVSEPEVLTKPEPKCISKRFSCYSGVDINHILANIDYLDPRDIEFIFDDFLDPSKPIPEEYFNFPEPPTHLPEIYYSERNSLAITSI
ncbi:hypothetical protein GGI07_002925 [Coemansia sp. Benny D115]|nr:hypothetical protein GGI07_002925 [Coemansia sp. Benny D115]